MEQWSSPNTSYSGPVHSQDTAADQDNNQDLSAHVLDRIILLACKAEIISE